jgi:hypothetical protein
MTRLKVATSEKEFFMQAISNMRLRDIVRLRYLKRLMNVS